MTVTVTAKVASVPYILKEIQMFEVDFFRNCSARFCLHASTVTIYIILRRTIFFLLIPGSANVGD